MRLRVQLVLALVAFAGIISSCSSPPPPPPPLPVAIEPVVVVPEPVPQPVPQPEPDPVPPPPELLPVPADSYAVSAEKYTTSLKEIRDLVNKLNGIVGEKKLEEWKAYLDTVYTKKYSDPSYLKEVVNNSAVLKQYNVKLKTIMDYFEWVVVPSRSKVVVDDISFIDEERVEAFTIIKSQKILLYQLKLYGKEWKISFW